MKFFMILHVYLFFLLKQQYSFKVIENTSIESLHIQFNKNGSANRLTASELIAQNGLMSMTELTIDITIFKCPE
jgi:hypothetical protein